MICDCSQNTGNVSGYSQEKVKHNIAVRSCVQLLRWYKRFISPLFPPSCRFTPTCSEYAIDALQKKGICYGTLLAVYRLLRCHPFARGGYDPVEK